MLFTKKVPDGRTDLSPEDRLKNKDGNSVGSRSERGRGDLKFLRFISPGLSKRSRDFGEDGGDFGRHLGFTPRTDVTLRTASSSHPKIPVP